MLNLGSCHIQDHGLQLLHHNLHQGDVTIEVLWLLNNELSSSSDSSRSDITINCNVKVLSISSNKAVGETPHFFTTIVSYPSSVIHFNEGEQDSEEAGC